MAGPKNSAILSGGTNLPKAEIGVSLTDYSA